MFSVLSWVAAPFVHLARWIGTMLAMIRTIFALFDYNKYLANVLLYNISWEDTRIDRKLLNVKGKSVLTLTSAGDNVLDALCEDASVVYSVDQNLPQTALMELKLAAIRVLDYDVFYQIFAQANGQLFRQYYASHLRAALPLNISAYFDSRPDFFDHFFHRGGSGTTAWIIVRVLVPLLGLSPLISGIKTCHTLEEQQALYQQHRPRMVGMVKTMVMLRLAKLLAWLAAVPTAQQEQRSTHWEDFFMSVIDHLFMHTFIRGDNHYFAAYIFGYYPQGNSPRYLKPEWFAVLKQRVGRVVVLSNSLANVYAKLIHDGVQVDRFNLLDHMDWMAPNAVLEEWDLITRVASKDALALWKSVSETPSPSVLAHVPNLASAAPQLSEFFRHDRTPTYRSIRIVRVPGREEQLLVPRAQPDPQATWAGDAQVLFHMYAAPLLRTARKHVGAASKVLCAPQDSSAVSRATMNEFYQQQATHYDSFRDRMLHGRPLLMQCVPVISQGVWCDIGGGTGFNLEYFSPAALRQWRSIYVIDICDALLQQATARVQRHGWQGLVHPIQRDCCSDKPIVLPVAADSKTDEPVLADLVTLSYSLSMMPDWEQALQQAYALVKPGGFIGVCDFTVVAPQAATARAFWTSLFAVDHVHLREAHRKRLAELFTPCVDEYDYGGFPYVPAFLKCPYYVFVGRKSAGTSPEISFHSHADIKIARPSASRREFSM